MFLLFCTNMPMSVCMSYDWQTIAILLDLTAHGFNRCAKIQKISRNPTPWFYQA